MIPYHLPSQSQLHPPPVCDLDDDDPRLFPVYNYNFYYEPVLFPEWKLRDPIFFPCLEPLSAPTNPGNPIPTSPVVAATPSGGLSGRARRRRRARRRKREAAARDWADGLGIDALLAIFHRLDHIDILTSADHVCRSWRRAAREEPSLWRRIAMRGHEGIARRLTRGGMACEALRRSAGQCEAFYGQYAGDDGFLAYLSEQAPCLKSLRLISCNGVSDEGLTVASKALPLLEELELSLCHNVGGSEVYKFVAKECPELKHFRQNKEVFNLRDCWGENKDVDVEGIASMHGLRSLQLFSNAITNEGLECILNNCPHLESLDIRHCFNVDMDETLLLKCATIKTLRLPDASTDDYDLEFQTPMIRTCVSVTEDNPCYSDGYHSPYDGFFNGSGSDCYDKDDSEDDTDFFGEPSRYECDLDKYDKVLPLSMRTFLK